MRVFNFLNDKAVTWLLVACTFLSAMGFMYSAMTQYNVVSNLQKTVRAQVKFQTLNAADEIDKALTQIMTSVDQFAKSVTALPNKQDINNILEDEFATNEDIYSLNVTFKPYQYEPTTRYFSPYLERLTGVEKRFNLVDYDKPDKTFSWYHRPLVEGSIWTEPYYEPQNNVLMTTYSVPFYRSTYAKQQGDEPLGVVPTDISLEALTTSLKKLELGLGGYGVIFSQKHQLISHPVFSYVREEKTFGELIKKPEFTYLTKINGCFEGDLSYKFFNGETLSNDEHYAACTKIPHTDWVLLTRMSADMFEVDKDQYRQQSIQIISWATVCLLFIILLLTHKQKLNWTQNNVCISILLMCSTVMVLEFARSLKSIENKDDVVITTLAQREAFTAGYEEQMHALHAGKAHYIAAGLYVESLEFVNANNVHLTGHAWQKLSPEQRDFITPKLMFNHTVNQTIREAYRQDLNDGSLLIGWHFSIETRQQFDYSKYPFDHKSIEISFNSSDMGPNVVLVPDLESYNKISKMDNPAVTSEIVLDEWLLKHSYFKYSFKSYNTNFGLDTFANQNVMPELSYTINIEREFIGPFVSTLLPVMVMVCLLYACVVSMTYTPYGDLRNNITAVVFTILLAHYSIREHLQIDEVVYFEVFYFLLYFISSIFMLIAHQYYKASELQLNARFYKRLANVWFWPMITSSVFFITIFTYY